MLKSLGPSSPPFPSPQKRAESLKGDSFMPFQFVFVGGTLSFLQSIGLLRSLGRIRPSVTITSCLDEGAYCNTTFEEGYDGQEHMSS